MSNLPSSSSLPVNSTPTNQAHVASRYSSRSSPSLQDERVTATVVEIQDLTGTIKLVTVKVDQDVSFLAGQFIGVYDVPDSTNGQDSQTSIFPGTFSIASAPHRMPHMSFAIGQDRNPRNMRHYLYYHAKPGETRLQLDSRGSGTVAVTPRMVMTPVGGPGGVLLIGGGTAVMGLVSVVEEFLHDVEGINLPSITLLHSNRSNKDVPFLERMKELQAQHSIFQYQPCITGKLEAGEQCVGHQGRIDRELLASKIPGNRLFLLCGSGVFCEAMVDMLLDLGVWPGSIRTDFTTRVDPSRRLREAQALQQHRQQQEEKKEDDSFDLQQMGSGGRKARFSALADGTQEKGGMASDADEFLRNYGLDQLLTRLEEGLRVNKPDYPIQYLLDELQKTQAKLPEVSNLQAADPGFWMSYWESDTVTWQAPVTSPWLERHLTAFLGDETASKKRVFVPLCGKSLDMLLLAEQGHHVIGAECSGIACSDFFTQNKIAGYVKETISQAEKGLPPIVCHKSTILPIELYECDIFHLTKDVIGGPVDAILDRAALVALHPSLIEDKYLPLLTSLLKPDTGRVLFASVSALPFPKAPPHVWETPMIEGILDDWFADFELLEVYRYRVNAGEVVEPIYLLNTSVDTSAPPVASMEATSTMKMNPKRLDAAMDESAHSTDTTCSTVSHSSSSSFASMYFL